MNLKKQTKQGQKFESAGKRKNYNSSKKFTENFRMIKKLAQKLKMINKIVPKISLSILFVVSLRTRDLSTCTFNKAFFFSFF